MAGTVPLLPNGGYDWSAMLANLDKMLGGQKSTENSTSTSTPDAVANEQETLLLQKIFADIDPANLDAMVGNMLDRAKQAFGPAAIGANAAGLRAYSDTVLTSMRNEAMARAVGEAANAKLEAIAKGNATAANLVGNRMANSKATSSNKASTTGASTLGKTAAGLTVGSMGLDLLKKLKKVIPDNSGLPPEDLANGGEGFINDQNEYGNINSGGEVSSTGGSAVGGTSSTIVDPRLLDPAALFDSSMMANQSLLTDQALEGTGELSQLDVLNAGVDDATLASTTADANTALEGAGELSDVPALTGLPTDGDLAALSTQANQGTAGTGELSEVPSLATGGAVGAGVIDVTSGAGSKILMDSGQTVTSQGASTAAEATDIFGNPIPQSSTAPTLDLSALDESAPDISTLTTQANEGLTGAGELSEVPALQTTTGGIESEAIGSAGADAVGGEATLGTAALPAAVMAAIVSTEAGQRLVDKGFTGVEHGLNALGIDTEGPAFNAFDATQPGMARTSFDAETGEATFMPLEQYYHPDSGNRDYGGLVTQDDNGEWQLPDGYNSWSEFGQAYDSQQGQLSDTLLTGVGA